ncbi:MAG TPA: RNA polymerase sigma factor, partial [Candidatus Hydrogenedentes bacterium]|nr:RNA polymerase sigma factor [Candidatus Hydrogenedentota bacterium]
YAIATNLALNALRSRQRRGQTVALDFETEPNEFDAQTEDARAMLMRGDVAHRLARAIGMLPAQPAALVNLHYMEGMSIREAAETLNMTEDAAKVALHRARKRLRILLGERE